MARIIDIFGHNIYQKHEDVACKHLKQYFQKQFYKRIVGCQKFVNYMCMQYFGFIDVLSTVFLPPSSKEEKKRLPIHFDDFKLRMTTGCRRKTERLGIYYRVMQ